MTQTKNIGKKWRKAKEEGQKIALIVRHGALGDCILLSPIFDELKDQGYFNIFYTTWRGKEVYKHDKRVDEIIENNEEIPIDDIFKVWAEVKKKIKPNYYKNFTSSIEENLAIHPSQALYTYPKKERAKRCNYNYYRMTKELSGLTSASLRPSLQFTDEEHKICKEIIKKDKFNIQWNLSGSGNNKVYPWTEFVMGSLIKVYPDIHIIQTGGEGCQLIESNKEGITNLSGKTSPRISFLLTKYADLLISPDTGVLHASGCFDTPKIGLLGHTTKENITKYFKNDYSIESQCDCAPCFYLIYDPRVQCPLDPISGASWCMAGIEPELLFDRVKQVKEKYDRDKT